MDMCVPKLLRKLERAVNKAKKNVSGWQSCIIRKEYNYSTFVEQGLFQCVEYIEFHDYGFVHYTESKKLKDKRLCVVKIIARNYVNSGGHEFLLEVPDDLYELTQGIPGCCVIPVYTRDALSLALREVREVINNLTKKGAG